MSGKRTVSEVVRYNGDVYVLHEAHDLVSPDYSGSGPEGDLIVSRDFDYGTVGLYHDETDGSFFSVVSLKQPKLGNMVYEFTSKEAAKKFFLELLGEGGGLGSPKINKEKAQLTGIWEPSKLPSKIIDVSGQVNRIARSVTVAQETAKPSRTPGSYTHELYTIAPNMGILKLFSGEGETLYSEATSAIETLLTGLFRQHLEKLYATVKDTNGTEGVKLAKEIVNPWVQDVVTDIANFGITGKGGVLTKLKNNAAMLSTSFGVPEQNVPAQETGKSEDEELLASETEEAPVETVEEVPSTPEAPTAPVEEVPPEPGAEEPAATAPTPGGPTVPAPKASVGTERTFSVTPELRAIFAASKQKYQLLTSAKRKIIANTQAQAKKLSGGK